MKKTSQKNINGADADPNAPSKKESRKVMVASMPEYDSNQVFLNKAFLKAYLNFFMKSKNFQRSYSRVYNQLLWGFEKNLNIGDFALLFVNPDFNAQITQATKGNYVTSEEASRHFDIITETSFEYGLKKKFLKNLRAAFLETFQELTDFEEVKLRSQKTDDGGHNFNNDVAVNLMKYAQDLDKNQSMPEHSMNHPHGQSMEQQSVIRGNEASKLNFPTTNELDPNQANRQGEHSNILNAQAPNNKSMPNVSKLGEKPPKPKKKPKPEKKTRAQEKEDELKKGDIRKIFAGGRFLRFQGENPNSNRFDVDIIKKMQALQSQNNLSTEHNVNSNFQSEAPNKKKELLWAKTANGVRDYLTLIRQLVYVIFAYQGVIIREFVSSGGSLIISVCYGHPNNIKKMAESMGISKPLDISLIDLMSLEPIDGKYRPLRANEVLWNKKKWKQTYFKTMPASTAPSTRNGSENKGLVNDPILPIGENLNDSKNLIKKPIDFERKPTVKVQSVNPVEDSTAMHKQKVFMDEDAPDELLADWQVTVDKVWVENEDDVKGLNTSMKLHDSIVNKSLLNEVSFIQDHTDVSINSGKSQNPKVETIDTAELQTRIVKLIQRINFKHIVRNCGGTWEKSDVNNELDNKTVRE